MKITKEHLRVFKDVHDRGCVVNFYYRYPTPYYGDGETQMPRSDYYLLAKLIKTVDKPFFDGYRIMTIGIDESDYVKYTDVTREFTDEAEFAGTFRRYSLTEAALKLLEEDNG